MKNKLKESIENALQTLGFASVDFALEYPKEFSHGDFATNVALIVAKQIANPPAGGPKEVAQSIVEVLEKQNIPDVESISVAGPGFINFTLSKEYFTNAIKEIEHQGIKWGTNTLFTGKKIVVEHSSPNLFKPFHIGHLMNNTIGESITRLAKNSGATVVTMSFPSDISLGIAKAIFILEEKYGTDFEPIDISVLGDAYVEGTKRYDEDEMIHGRVKEIANNLYERTPSPEWNMYEKCKAFNIAYFESVTARLGSHFDTYMYESEAGEVGKSIVLGHTPSVFTNSDGAVVYIPQESNKRINTAVFINSQGNPTYEAKDIGLLSLKFDRFNPDLSIFITDHHQVSHFEVVLDAAEKIQPSWKEKSLHAYHGRMSFKGQKMSSRLGGVPLVEEMVAVVSEEAHTKSDDLPDGITRAIALAAIKFSILRSQTGKDINFDPETSLSFEGDSGPYLQYTAVRARSILQKGKEQGLNPSFEIVRKDLTTELERILVRFPKVVEHATHEWAPHHIVGYLLGVAQAFNSWYSATKILDAENPETPYNLFLTKATVQTLTNGLFLLGITVPEKM